MYDLFNAGSSKVSDEVNAILICREMKWDYYTFMIQPTWFVSGINILLSIEGQYAKAKSKERQHLSS